MIFKQLDFLSPTITFYYKGYLSHSSILSGIISVFSFLLIMLLAIQFSFEMIKKEHPTAFYFNRFEEDAGIFPLNSSSLFHFISLTSFNKKDFNNKGIDFQSFRIIGLESYYPTYIKNNNISRYDHWLYGYCNKEIDGKDIQNLINHDFFHNSACIKKYFNSIEQKYYDIWEPNFRWPVIAHGTYNSDNKFYCILLERCKEETLNIILNGNNHCRNDDEINTLIGYNSLAHFFFIDNYIDVLNYESPNTKFLYRIDNFIKIDSYTINNLNFFPFLIKTNKGLLFDKINNELSYSYERNDIAFNNDNNQLFTVYYLWLNNRINYYERNYKKIQDVISNIGGIFQFITFVAIYINRFYNKYILLSDTLDLLNSSIDFEKQKDYHIKKRIEHPKKVQDINHKKIHKINNAYLEKDLLKNKNIINSKNKNISDKGLSKTDELCITNIDIIKDEINNKDKKNEKKDNKKRSKKDNKNNNKTNHSFWNYVLFKLSFEKKNTFFKINQNFRIKIISEEHLIRNHLNIYNLLRVNERKLNSKKRYSYQLKDLINLV